MILFDILNRVSPVVLLLAGILLFLLLLRPLRALYYNFKVKAIGGIHAPKLPGSLIAGSPPSLKYQF
jgi:hypothetical protein